MSAAIDRLRRLASIGGPHRGEPQWMPADEGRLNDAYAANSPRCSRFDSKGNVDLPNMNLRQTIRTNNAGYLLLWPHVQTWQRHVIETKWDRNLVQITVKPNIHMQVPIWKGQSRLCRKSVSTGIDLIVWRHRCWPSSRFNDKWTNTIPGANSQICGLAVLILKLPGLKE